LVEDTALKTAARKGRGFDSLSLRFGPVAQRQEQLPYKQTVGGSSPPGITGRKGEEYTFFSSTFLPPLPPFFRPRSPAWSGRLSVTQEIVGSNPIEGAYGKVRKQAKRRSSKLRDFVGSTPALATR
jgi:hypothetical protein